MTVYECTEVGGLGVVQVYEDEDVSAAVPLDGKVSRHQHALRRRSKKSCMHVHGQ